MNFRLGLERLSLVFFGFLTVLFAGLAVFVLMSGDGWANAIICLVAAAACFALHKVVMWIVAGFCA